MKKLFIILSFSSGLLFSEPCVKEDKRLSTLQTFEVEELTINLYGIPMYESLQPFSEGCPDDAGILVFHSENKKPIFLRYGNFQRQSILKESDLENPDWWIEKPYKKILDLTDKNNLLIKQLYTGNCGGCFNVLVFAPGEENVFKGELYYEPDKYSDNPEPKIIQYNSNGKEIKEHDL